MKFVSDPAIATKISRMNERVRWQHNAIRKRGIDQTRFVLDDDDTDNPDFSFLVIGDTGSGSHQSDNPQRRIAEQMLERGRDCKFVLHTGDVVYLVGSSEQYPENFIYPYRHLLVGGDRPDSICYDQMVFQRPFFPVLGNHDYYDLPLVYGLAVQLASPFRRLMHGKLDLDVGWHGSHQGDAYARAFLDYLKGQNWMQLEPHLDRHYTAKVHTGRCLRYEPGEFTRLPNRYYAFQVGGIDFFALDSNTFNAPEPVSSGAERDHLLALRDELEQQKQDILDRSAGLNPESPEDAEQIDELHAKFEQIDEEINDMTKQLTESSATTTTDVEQLRWLRQGLIESWHTADVRGRVIFFHHPPYITEATKWNQGQTLAVRHRLRRVLDEVNAAVGDTTGDRPLVDLVLNGHAHCLDYLRTEDTGHADANINWLVCGGSGYSLRRQRQEGDVLTEAIDGQEERPVARSHLFVGRHGHGSHKHRPYTFVRVDVRAGTPPAFTIRPFVADRFHHQWHYETLDPFVI